MGEVRITGEVRRVLFIANDGPQKLRCRFFDASTHRVSRLASLTQVLQLAAMEPFDTVVLDEGIGKSNAEWLATLLKHQNPAIVVLLLAGQPGYIRAIDGVIRRQEVPRTWRAVVDTYQTGEPELLAAAR